MKINCKFVAIGLFLWGARWSAGQVRADEAPHLLSYPGYKFQPVTLSAGIVLISTYLCPKALSVMVGTPQQCAVKAACGVRKPHVPLLQSPIIKLIPLIIVDNLLWGKWLEKTLVALSRLAQSINCKVVCEETVTRPFWRHKNKSAAKVNVLLSYFSLPHMLHRFIGNKQSDLLFVL